MTAQEIKGTLVGSTVTLVSSPEKTKYDGQTGKKTPSPFHVLLITFELIILLLYFYTFVYCLPRTSGTQHVSLNLLCLKTREVTAEQTVPAAR